MSARRARVVVAVVLLSLSATSGALDAFAFLNDQVFVANQTGNLVVVALDIAGVGFAGAVGASVVALIGFSFGMVGTLALARWKVADNASRPWLLVIEGVVLAAAVALVATGGHGYPTVALLAFSQGIQGVVFTRLLGQGFRTVAITGAMVDTARMAAAGSWGKAWLAACPPLGYGIGAVAGALAARGLGAAAPVVLAVIFCLVAAGAFRQAEGAGIDID